MKNVRALVCFAMKEEARAFLKSSAMGSDTSILVTGIGRKNTQKRLAEYLKNHSPQIVLTCGFAGGLNPALKTGDAVFETNNSELRERLLNANARPAIFVCSERIATTATEKASLRASTGGDAVEMESEVIQTVCRGRNISCATVRVILDTATEDLPLDFNKLSNANLTLNPAKLALAIATSPGKIPALMRLQKHCTFAAQRLADVLAEVLRQR